MLTVDIMVKSSLYLKSLESWYYLPFALYRLDNLAVIIESPYTNFEGKNRNLLYCDSTNLSAK